MIGLRFYDANMVRIGPRTVDADKEGVGGDDAADALRYLIATKPPEVRQRKLAGV